MLGMIPAALAHLDPTKVEEAVAKIAMNPLHGQGDPYFAYWLRLVNRRVSGMIGLGIGDIADSPYRDWFDCGYTPQEAAQEALENDDTFGFLDGLFD